MGYQVIKQPDGKLAIFSSYTDSWAEKDLLPADVINFFADIAESEARRDATKIVANVLADEPRKSYYQFTRTYEEAQAYHAWSQEGAPHPLGDD
jgi:hypothetical protein